MEIQLKVNTPEGEEIIFHLCKNAQQLSKMTVLQIKDKIAGQLHIGDNMWIVYGNVPLEEDKLVVSYGIQHMSTIHIALKMPGGF